MPIAGVHNFMRPFTKLLALAALLAAGVVLYFGRHPADALLHVAADDPPARADDAGWGQPFSPTAAPPPPISRHAGNSPFPARPFTIPAPASLRSAYPELHDIPADWRQFNREAKSLTVAPYPDLPLTFQKTGIKDEGDYSTWFGANPDIPGSSLIAVATPGGGYHTVMIVPGSSQFAFDTSPTGVTTIAESQPGEEGCAVGGLTPDRTTAQTPTTAALFRAQYTAATAAYHAAYAPPLSNYPNGETMETPKATGTATYQRFTSPVTEASLPNGGFVSLIVWPGTTEGVTIPITGYQWYYNGTAIAGATGNAYLASAIGNYAVTVYWADGATQPLIPVKVITRPATAATQIGVLVLYDTDTLANAGSADTIDGRSKAYIEAGNIALAQSLVTNFQWKYLGAVPARDYVRPPATDNNFDLRAIGSAGLIGDWVADQAGKYGAAQVVLWRGDGAGSGGSGVAQTGGKGVSVGKASAARAVAIWSTSYKVMIHELGHNFGCQHDRAHAAYYGGAYDPEKNSVPDGDGHYSYGALWSVPNPSGGADTASTIMGYGSSVIPYFSNPNLTVNVTSSLAGSASGRGDWGVLPLGWEVANPKAAYNAKVLMDNAPTMAAFGAASAMPAIIAQPQSISSSSGSSFTLSVAAAGSDLSYQWFKDGRAIEGATTASYTATASNSTAGNYTVTVSNIAGSVTSATAAVAVSAAPAPSPASGGSGGGGGGGGAPAPWFLGALVLLVVTRRVIGHRS